MRQKKKQTLKPLNSCKSLSGFLFCLTLPVCSLMQCSKLLAKWHLVRSNLFSTSKFSLVWWSKKAVNFEWRGQTGFRYVLAHCFWHTLFGVIFESYIIVEWRDTSWKKSDVQNSGGKYEVLRWFFIEPQDLAKCINWPDNHLASSWHLECFFIQMFNFYYTLQCKVWGDPVVDRFGGTFEESTKEKSNGSNFFLEKSKILYHFVFVSATDFKKHKKWDTWYLKNLPTSYTFFHTLKHSNIEKRHMKQTSAKTYRPIEIIQWFCRCLCFCSCCFTFLRRATFSYNNG